MTIQQTAEPYSHTLNDVIGQKRERFVSKLVPLEIQTMRRTVFPEGRADRPESMPTFDNGLRATSLDPAVVLGRGTRLLCRVAQVDTSRPDERVCDAVQ